MKAEDYIIGQIVHVNNTNLLGVITSLHLDQENPVELKILGYEERDGFHLSQTAIN